MSNWSGFNKTPMGAGGHVVIAGRQRQQADDMQEAPIVQSGTPTKAAGTGVFVPFEDKEQRINYLQNMLEVLQNLTITVEAQLQQEIES